MIQFHGCFGDIVAWCRCSCKAPAALRLGPFAPLRVLIEHSYTVMLLIFRCRFWQAQPCSDKVNPQLLWMKDRISLQCLYPGTNRSDWVHWSWGKSLLKHGNAVLIWKNRFLRYPGESEGAIYGATRNSAFPLIWVLGIRKLSSAFVWSCIHMIWQQERACNCCLLCSFFHL